MVFQHFSLFETLTVAENIALALASATATCAELAARIREVSDKLRACRSIRGASCTRCRSASASASRSCAACCRSRSLLIMDEPTSVLTPQAVRKLFETLRRLAAEGCSILYISHKLDEIRALCDTATVLRGGRVTGTCDPARGNVVSRWRG